MSLRLIPALCTTGKPVFFQLNTLKKTNQTPLNALQKRRQHPLNNEIPYNHNRSRHQIPTSDNRNTRKLSPRKSPSSECNPMNLQFKCPSYISQPPSDHGSDETWRFDSIQGKLQLRHLPTTPPNRRPQSHRPRILTFLSRILLKRSWLDYTANTTTSLYDADQNPNHITCNTPLVEANLT